MSHERRTPNRRIMFGVAVVGLLVALFASVYYLGYTQQPSSTGGSDLMQATCSSLPSGSGFTVQHIASGGTGDHAYFLIVEADPPSPYAGINGSYYVPTTTQWPVLNVRLGQVVSIHVINCASSEVHGFAIQKYDDNSLISIPTGQHYDVTFTASEAGTFRVYCDVPCLIHPLMQNGALIVS